MRLRGEGAIADGGPPALHPNREVASANAATNMTAVAAKKGRLWSVSKVVLLGFVIRIVLFLYSILHDKYLEVPYTDVDYFVFADAAKSVADGKSPFDRKTYRYSPFLSWMLLPNTVVGEWWGKLLFVLFDLLAGQIAANCLQRHLAVSEEIAAKLSALWLLNPISINVSTRGNAESLICLLVVLALSALYARRALTAGLLLGLATHAKIYPIIYVPVFGLYLSDAVELQLERGFFAVSDVIRMAKRVLSCFRCWLFLVAFLVGFGVPTLWAYQLYGNEFLDEALLYHVKRSDHKHNFSIYFYLFYLIEGGQWSSLISKLCFVPQFLLTALAALSLFRTPALAAFVQTLVFIALNKVYTVQYFCWYLCLLPLAANEVSLPKRPTVAIGAFAGASLALWLGSAYYLEFQSRETFKLLTLASALCLLSQSSLAALFTLHRRRLSRRTA